MTPTCGRARRLAWGKGDPVVTSVERARALAHVGTCADCRRFAADMDRLRGAVGAALRPEAVPEGLARRLHARVQAGRAERRRLVRWFRTGLAAAAILIAATAIWPRPRALRDEISRALRDEIIERRRERLAEPGLKSSDAGEVQAWIDRHAPFHVHVASFPDARLTGVTVAVIAGGPAVVIRFQVGDQFMLYAATAADPTRTADSSFQRQVGRSTATITWRAGGLDHLWVGSIPIHSLASFAARCAEQAKAAMRSHA